MSTISQTAKGNTRRKLKRKKDEKKKKTPQFA